MSMPIMAEDDDDARYLGGGFSCWTTAPGQAVIETVNGYDIGSILDVVRYQVFYPVNKEKEMDPGTVWFQRVHES